jgi:hypothetical protein
VMGSGWGSGFLANTLALPSNRQTRDQITKRRPFLLEHSTR